MPNPQDERHGLPSASSALADSLCPGRWRAQKEWDEQVGAVIDLEEDAGSTDDLDKDAEAGKRIHRLYAGEEVSEATEPERKRAQLALTVDQEMFRRWSGGFGFDEPIQCLPEYRWWLKDGDGQELYSGQTDKIWVRGKANGPCDVLLADLKGLWGYHDPAALNVQIRRYAALIAATIADLGYTEVRTIAAYLNQPAVSTKPQVALFEKEELAAAVADMWSDVCLMLDPEAPRNPGHVQCHHCRAKLICEPFQTYVPALPVVPHPSAEIPIKPVIEHKVALLSNGKLEELMSWKDALSNLVDMVESEAKRRLRQDPESFGGRWFLRMNPAREKISDVMTVWQRLSTSFADLTAQEFVKKCSVTKKAVEEILREKGGMKGKSLETKLELVLEGATSSTVVSPTLARNQ